jgi:hypothetical protein
VGALSDAEGEIALHPGFGTTGTATCQLPTAPTDGTRITQLSVRVHARSTPQSRRASPASLHVEGAPGAHLARLYSPGIPPPPRVRAAAARRCSTLLATTLRVRISHRGRRAVTSPLHRWQSPQHGRPPPVAVVPLHARARRLHTRKPQPGISGAILAACARRTHPTTTPEPPPNPPQPKRTKTADRAAAAGQSNEGAFGGLRRGSYQARAVVKALHASSGKDLRRS